MEYTEKTNIRLIVDDEQSLYIRFSPEAELSEGVRSYIKSKIAGKYLNNDISLTVISSAPIDETRFKAAVMNWIREEKEKLSQDVKTTLRLLVGMLAVATIFIILSMSLTKQYNVISYTIIPVLGSVALGRAAGICVTEMPIKHASLQLVREMENNSKIFFEYGDQ